MAQTINTSINPTSESGTQLASDLNGATASFLSQHSGAARPSYAVAGTLWLNSTTGVVFLYDGAQDIPVFTYDPVNHLLNPPVGGGQATLASSATVDLGSVAPAAISITGTTSITGFGTSAQKGQIKFLTFAAALTLTNSASLILPGGANITTAAGDAAAALYQGSGVWKIIDYTPAAGSAPISSLIGASANIKCSVAAAGASATFTADEIVLGVSLGGAGVKIGPYSQTINLATTGAGGMDTGAAPASGFVSIYAIWGPAGTSILAVNAATSGGTIYSGSHMPSGYVYSALISTWPTNGSGLFIVGNQVGRTVLVGSLVVLNGGNASTLTSINLSAVVPLNAKSVLGTAGQQSASFQSIYMYSASNGTAYAQFGNSSGIIFGPFTLPIVVAQTIYYHVDNSSGSGFISIGGYTF